jgi:hypothetical protein
MKRLTCLLSFVIIVLAMPLAAFAEGRSGDGRDQEQRVEIRVEREREGGPRGEGRERRIEIREMRDGEGGEWQPGDLGMHEMLRGMWRGKGEGGDWQGMHERAGGMMRGIHKRGMRINFQPEIEESVLALGMNNKAIQADTINININIGDVMIDGNELSGGDSGELLEMIMEMMMKAHGQNGPGMGHGGSGGPGMQHGGPGNSGPGAWHERFDGNHPPLPGMPPQMDWHEEGRHGEHGGIEWNDDGRHGEHGGNEWHDGAGGQQGLRSDAGDGGQRFWSLFHGRRPSGSIQTNQNYDSQYRDQTRTPRQTEPVEEGGVRSPYHDFYFGNGELPRGEFIFIEGHDIHDGHAGHGAYDSQPQSAQQAAHAGQNIRPELLRLMEMIPADVPVEFVEMMMKLGRRAHEDPALREQLMQLLQESYRER